MYTMMLKIVFIVVLSISAGSSLEERATQFKFSKYYENHMVLQKGHRTSIWGTSGKVGDTVHIRINGSDVGVTTVGANHIWEATFSPPPGQGPYQVTAHSSVGDVTINDVWFGDVWICSGQSNMEFMVDRLINHTEEYTDAVNFPKIRLFKVHHTASNTTVPDVNKIDYQWSIPSQATLKYFSAVCWLYGKQLSQHLGYPIGLVESNWGGTPIEAWSSPQAIAKCPVTHTHKKRAVNSHTPNALYNGMIYPLLRNTIKGVIWYQGESNSGRAANYACQFPAMIKDWRHKFYFASKHTTNVNFPFGFVQLAPSRAGFQYVSGFTDLRWSQTANIGYVPNAVMPNTFMAVAIDLPDFTSPYGTIHPRYKHDIARRLALSALAVAYNETGFDYQGPFPSSITVNGHSTLTIEFDHGKTPIAIRSSQGFEICCTTTKHTCPFWDHGWHNATMVTHTDSAVVLDIKSCQHIGGVRYLWRMSPCELRKCAVYGRDSSLPAPPFKDIRTFL